MDSTRSSAVMDTVYRKRWWVILTRADSSLTTVTNVNNRILTIQLSLGSAKLPAADGDLCSVEISGVVIVSGETQREPISSVDGMGDEFQGGCNLKGSVLLLSP
jgi:hypothetical protein